MWLHSNNVLVILSLQVTKKPFSAREAARFLALSYRSEGKTAFEKLFEFHWEAIDEIVNRIDQPLAGKFSDDGADNSIRCYSVHGPWTVENISADR